MNYNDNKQLIPLSTIIQVLVTQWSERLVILAASGDIESMRMLAKCQERPNGWGVIAHCLIKAQATKEYINILVRDDGYKHDSESDDEQDSIL